MKKVVYFLLLILSSLSSTFGQSYQLILPNVVPGMMNPSALLDFSLVLTDNNPHFFTLTIQVDYGSTNANQTPAATMSSEQITLETNHPFSSYPEAQAVLQSIVFTNTQFQDYYFQHGLFPSGSYLVCYTLTEIQEPYTINQCLTIEAQSTPELILIAPPDGSTIELTNPIFTWLYPQMLSPTNSYKFSMVEVYEEQTPEQAFLSNPILFSDYSFVPFLIYPITAPPLDSCHQYAWNIALLDNQNQVEQSEIWSFLMSCPETDTTSTELVFYPLSEEDLGSVYTVGRYLNFTFDQYYLGIDDFTIDIYDLAGNVIIPYGELVELKMNTPNTCFNGTNLFQIDLETLGFFNEGTYVLRVKNQKQNYSLKFQRPTE